jgi:hypothetical protein
MTIERDARRTRRIRVGLPFLLLLALPALAGCSMNDQPGASTQSQVACLLPGACLLATGVTSATLGAVEGDCTDGKGTIASACPTTGVIGCCIFAEEGDASEILCAYNDSGVMGDASATTACAQ